MRNRPIHLADESQRGAVASEYAVLLSILAVGLVAAVLVLSTAISTAVSTAGGIVN